MAEPETGRIIVPLSATGRRLVLVVAFLGWLFAGVHMAITQMVGRPAALDLLHRTGEIDAEQFKQLNERAARSKKKSATSLSAEQAPTNTIDDLSAAEKQLLGEWRVVTARWFPWFQCAFLFGAAAGGLVFGRLGDRVGRSKAMAASILTYSGMAGATALAQSPIQFWALWFLAGMGVGGMWPNGVALVSEVWAGLSRPATAGLIGMSANIGLFLMPAAALWFQIKVTPDHWRWTMVVGAMPILLGLFALVAVPESPRWLAAQAMPLDEGVVKDSVGTVFRPPYLGVTLIAIVLASIPVIGGWGTTNWMNPWANEAGEAVGDLHLQSKLMQARALPGILGSLLGGWIASRLGRRLTYFLVSLASLLIAQYMFWYLTPIDPWFLFWAGVLGFVSGVYFGWLPLCLPELFPTRVRSTGAGVGFNFGRIITAMLLFLAGVVMSVFKGDYASIGRATSLLFILGMVAVCFTPDTSRKQLED
jgi:MFS transporter, SHS family, sialic acid transporter